MKCFVFAKCFGLVLFFSSIGLSAPGEYHIWQFEKEGKASYLLGTFHMVGATYLPSFVAPLVGQSSGFVMESNPEEMVAYSQKLMTESSSSEPLQKKLSPKAWKQLVTELSENFLEPADINEMSPQVAGLILGGLRSSKVTQLPETQSILAELGLTSGMMDVELFMLAKAQGIATQAFETPEAALAVLDGANLEKLIFQTPEELAQQTLESMRIHKKLVATYSSPKLSPFKDALYGEAIPTPTSAFIGRHSEWISKITQLQNNSFVAVGAMHLIGRNGLLAMLKARGYKITRLTQLPIKTCAFVLKK